MEAWTDRLREAYLSALKRLLVQNKMALSQRQALSVSIVINPLGTLKPRATDQLTAILVRWPLMGGQLLLVQRGGDRAGPQTADAPPSCTIKIHSHLGNVRVLITETHDHFAT